MSVNPYNTGCYENLWLESLPKNEAKRTQNEPNFSPKLASFSQYRLCFSPEISIKCLTINVIALCPLCSLWQKLWKNMKRIKIRLL